jgi:hypothetical protein
MAKQEWKRTCARDGVEWFVTDQERRRSGKVGQFRARYKESVGSLINDAGMVLAAQRLRDPARCPSCGSGEYAEQPG